MINKDILTKYVKIMSGCDVDTNLTLVDFSFNEEQRNIVNLVNNEAKKSKELSNLLEDLKYSNNKNLLIENYFEKLENNKESNINYKKEKIDNYGYINLPVLSLIVGFVTLMLSLIVTIYS